MPSGRDSDNRWLMVSKIHRTLRLVIAEEGARSLYGGLGAHLMRVVPNASVMFWVYDSTPRRGRNSPELDSWVGFFGPSYPPLSKNTCHTVFMLRLRNVLLAQCRFRALFTVSYTVRYSYPTPDLRTQYLTCSGSNTGRLLYLTQG